MNAKTPILVGVGQVLNRIEHLDEAKEPIVMMLQAIRSAAEDAGIPDLLRKTQSVRVVRGIWG